MEMYIASMNMRGKWAESPEGCQRINVTSSQAKNSKNRLAFSPMTPVENGYKGYYCFENYWQAGKRYKGLEKPEDLQKQDKWWKSQTKGFRRYPKGKGLMIKYAEYPGFNYQLDYINSRKEVYVPEYYNLVKDNLVLNNLLNEVKNGKCIVVYDFDGSRLDNGDVTCLRVTNELLREKLNSSKSPFGHGYIIAGILAGYHPKDYLD